MDKMIVELAPFKVASGVTREAVLEASALLQKDFLMLQPGFIKRELLQSGESEWLDLVYWRDHDSAQQAMRKAMESPVCHQYFQVMEGEDHNNPGNGVKLYERLSEY